jgi:hypothetical protein
MSPLEVDGAHSRFLTDLYPLPLLSVSRSVCLARLRSVISSDAEPPRYPYQELDALKLAFQVAVFLLGCLTAALYAAGSSYLKRHYPSIWAKLEKPGLLHDDLSFSSLLYWGFLFHGGWRRLPDRTLRVICLGWHVSFWLTLTLFVVILSL